MTGSGKHSDRCGLPELTQRGTKLPLPLPFVR